MAREIVSFCDNHSIDENVQGKTRRVDLGSGPREVELCDGCYVQLVEPLEKLLADHGRDVGPLTEDPKKKLRCPWCPTGLSTPRNLRDHVDTRHPQHVEAFVEGLVNPKPTRGRRVGRPAGDSDQSELEFHPAGDGAEGKRKPGRFEPQTCVCGKVCGTPQGFGGHKRSCPQAKAQAAVADGAEGQG